jgi:hypothetical protein
MYLKRIQTIEGTVMKELFPQLIPHMFLRVEFWRVIPITDKNGNWNYWVIWQSFYWNKNTLPGQNTSAQTFL